MAKARFIPPQLQTAEKLYQSGRIWLTAREAAKMLNCDQASLLTTARDRGTLGSLEFIWSGNFLKISTMSVIRFLEGGN